MDRQVIYDEPFRAFRYPENASDWRKAISEGQAYVDQGHVSLEALNEEPGVTIGDLDKVYQEYGYEFGITLVGNLEKDPEIKKVGDQSKAVFTLAVERYLGKDKEPAVDFFNVVSWGKLAEVCGSFLNKGKKVIVDGRIQVRTYMKDKERHWITEIVAENLRFLSTPPATAEAKEAE